MYGVFPVHQNLFHLFVYILCNPLYVNSLFFPCFSGFSSKMTDFSVSRGTICVDSTCIYLESIYIYSRIYPVYPLCGHNYHRALCHPATTMFSTPPWFYLPNFIARHRHINRHFNRQLFINRHSIGK